MIDALKDTDYFVRQEAIASILKIGKPAAALPLLTEIRDAKVANAFDENLQQKAAAAIRIPSDPVSNR